MRTRVGPSGLATPGRSRRLVLALLPLMMWQPARALGQGAAGADSLSTQAEVRLGRAYPDFRRGRELILSGIGVGLSTAGGLVSPDLRTVPEEGLDPREISWSIDRRDVGSYSRTATRASHWTGGGATVVPFVLAAATARTEERWRSVASSGGVYAEAMLISQGLTAPGKAISGRARPFAYLPVDDRPGGSDYDTSSERAFRSMPQWEAWLQMLGGGADRHTSRSPGGTGTLTQASSVAGAGFFLTRSLPEAHLFQA